MEFKPYDPDAACPRCGRTPVGTRNCDYVSPRPGLGLGHWPVWVMVVGGHLHRQCGRCDHEWVELALGARMMTDEERKETVARYEAAIEGYLGGLPR